MLVCGWGWWRQAGRKRSTELLEKELKSTVVMVSTEREQHRLLVTSLEDRLEAAMREVSSSARADHLTLPRVHTSTIQTHRIPLTYTETPTVPRSDTRHTRADSRLRVFGECFDAVSVLGSVLAARAVEARPRGSVC